LREELEEEDLEEDDREEDDREEEDPEEDDPEEEDLEEDEEDELEEPQDGTTSPFLVHSFVRSPLMTFVTHLQAEDDRDIDLDDFIVDSSLAMSALTCEMMAALFRVSPTFRDCTSDVRRATISCITLSRRARSPPEDVCETWSRVASPLIASLSSSTLALHFSSKALILCEFAADRSKSSRVWPCSRFTAVSCSSRFF